MFMVREIEGSLALRIHVAVNKMDLTITWRLPVSKSDPEAIGSERTRGCACVDEAVIWDGCVYHAALSHLHVLDQMFGPVGVDDDLPLFPQLSGQPISPETAVNVVEELAQRTGEKLCDNEGNKLFG